MKAELSHRRFTGAAIALFAVVSSVAAAGCSSNTDSQPGAPTSVPPAAQAQIQNYAASQATMYQQRQAAQAAGAAAMARQQQQPH